MHDQRGGDSAVAVVLAGVVLLVCLMAGAGFFLWQWRRTITAQRMAEVARLEAEMQRQVAAEALAHSQAQQSLGDAGTSDSETSKLSESESAAIKDVLAQQQAAWNRGDIDAVMDSYWKSDELTFSSGGETTRSWQATLDRYKQKYTTPEKMGHLQFGSLEVFPLAAEAAYVLGRWELADNVGGNFSLILRKLEGRWVIVHDHTSVLQAAESVTGETGLAPTE